MHSPRVRNPLSNFITPPNKPPAKRFQFPTHAPFLNLTITPNRMTEFFYVDSDNITNVTTLEGVMSDSTRVFLIVYNIIVITLGLCGNGFVLYGSIRHRAIRMDKISVLFVENLAFSDIIITIVYYVPMLVTLIKERWVFGKALCFLSAFYFTNVPFINELLLIGTISLYRMWVLKKAPGQRERIPIKHVKLFLSSFWLLGIMSCTVYVLFKCHAVYRPETLNCQASNFYELNQLVPWTIVVVILFMVLPIVLVIIANVCIIFTVMKHAQKAGKRTLNKITVITISSICVCFVVSYCPYCINLILRCFDVKDQNWFVVTKCYMLSFNTMANPFIYTMTNKPFRDYIKQVIWHFTHTVHTQYTHSTHTVHTQYTHSTHTVHTQYTHSAHTVHTQYIAGLSPV